MTDPRISEICPSLDQETVAEVEKFLKDVMGVPDQCSLQEVTVKHLMENDLLKRDAAQKLINAWQNEGAAITKATPSTSKRKEQAEPIGKTAPQEKRPKTETHPETNERNRAGTDTPQNMAADSKQKQEILENFKKNVEKKAMKICKEKDLIRGDEIAIAPLQISEEERNMSKLKKGSHFHRRKDIIKIFSEKSSSIISHKQIFDNAKQHTETDTCTTAHLKHTHSGHDLVFISGNAGIGKSTLCKAIVQEMLDPKIHLYEAEFVFFIRFRDLDYEGKIDLLQFLTMHDPFVSNLSEKKKNIILQHIQASNNVYLVMDGLDEASIDPKLDYPNCNSSSNTAAIFTKNILSGHLLPLSKKIVTSRPRRISQLPNEYLSSLHLTLMGLSDKGQSQICSDICENDSYQQKTIIEQVNARPDLKSLCYVPINCIMVMMLFLQSTLSERDDTSRYTLSSILVTSLRRWFLKKVEKWQIKEMSFLAFKGFSSSRYYFKDVHLRTAKVNFENATALLTNNITFRLLEGNVVTYFAHLIWQEFFVAINLRLYTDKEGFKKFLDKLDKDEYEVVTQFLFGLCNSNTLDDLLSNVEIEETIDEDDRKECREMLKNFALDKLKVCNDTPKARPKNSRKNVYFYSILPILGWVLEMGDDDFTEQAAGRLKDEIQIDNCQILPSDIPRINHVLRARDSELSLIVYDLQLVGDCSHYFFKELHITLNENVNIQMKELCLENFKVDGDLLNFIYSSHCIDKVESLALPRGDYTKETIAIIVKKIKKRENRMECLNLMNITNMDDNVAAMFMDCLNNIEDLRLNGPNVSRMMKNQLRTCGREKGCDVTIF